MDLQMQVEEALARYGDKVKGVLQTASQVAAKRAVEKLKRVSPKRKGKYAKEWGSQETERGGYVVYNKKHYHMTHLLEFGHALRGGGRTRAQQHIATVEKEAIDDYGNEIRRGIEGIGG